MAIFYFMNWIVAAETTQGGNYSRKYGISDICVDHSGCIISPLWCRLWNYTLYEFEFWIPTYVYEYWILILEKRRWNINDKAHFFRSKISSSSVNDLTLRDVWTFDDWKSSHFSKWCQHGTKISPRGWIFLIMNISNLKKFTSRSNEGSNFIMSSLEVGRGVAQT